MCLIYMPNGHDLESFLCSLAQAADCSEANYLDGAPSDTLNLTNTANKSYSNESETDYLTMRQSLETYANSLATDGRQNTEDMLTLCREVFHASHTAEAGSNLPKMMIETCGPQPLASLMPFGQNGAYWKTYQESLIPDMSGELLPIWPKAVMWDLQHIYRRWDLAQITAGIECGLSPSVPTVSKSDYKGASAKRFVGSPHYRGTKMSEGLRTCESDPIYLHPDYAEAAMMWPIMWTALAPLEMGKFQQWLRQFGIY